MRSGAGMMSEIMQRGPITCSIACPDDFIFNYTGGVWTDRNNASDVDHDVEVVGWGHEDGKDFWHIRNSWGEISSAGIVYQTPKSCGHQSVSDLTETQADADAAQHAAMLVCCNLCL